MTELLLLQVNNTAGRQYYRVTPFVQVSSLTVLSLEDSQIGQYSKLWRDSVMIYDN